MLRPAPYAAILGLLLLAASAPAQPVVEYRDNPRPILLDLHPEEAGISRVQVYFSEPRRGRMILDVTRDETETTGLARRLLRHPTLRAKALGKALPMTAYVGNGIARFCRTDAGEMALFWGLRDHVGAAFWPWNKGERLPVITRARALEKAFTTRGETVWMEYARTLPAGSHVAILFAERSGGIRIFGGEEQEARREADRQLRQALSIGSDWRPVRGMHSPSFLAGRPGPVGAMLLAGPVLIEVGSDRAEQSLRDLAGLIRRPLPAAPEVGRNPLGGGR